MQFPLERKAADEVIGEEGAAPAPMAVGPYTHECPELKTWGLHTDERKGNGKGGCRAIFQKFCCRFPPFMGLTLQRSFHTSGAL